MDTIKKLTELIEDGNIKPNNPIRKPSEANFIDAAYDDGCAGCQPLPAAINPNGNTPKGKL
jgi:hypothetical protein